MTMSWDQQILLAITWEHSPTSFFPQAPIDTKWQRRYKILVQKHFVHIIRRVPSGGE